MRASLFQSENDPMRIPQSVIIGNLEETSKNQTFPRCCYRNQTHLRDGSSLKINPTVRLSIKVQWDRLFDPNPLLTPREREV